ncbi:GntR family transcriptional regulator [Pelagimonas sp. KU-00592-HH]|uniref:GntR family transcriptional regulator n=1 Tax=Pelagimonas sp. KU-00592-HH TaxID=3127651 RepID=UPI003106BE4B
MASETTTKVKKKAKPTAKPARGGGGRHVYETLKREILELDLSPGTPLDEAALAERFAMSRSPIREALVRLSAEGMVEMLSNRTTIVTPINLMEFPRYVEALDLLQRITTRLAAQYRTEADLTEMKQCAEAYEDACRSEDHLDMSATNKAFHMAVAKAGRNPYLMESYGRLLDEGRRILHMHFEFTKNSVKGRSLGPEHFTMIEAIERQDADAADRLAHEHTALFHDRFFDFLQAKYHEDFKLQIS